MADGDGRGVLRFTCDACTAWPICAEDTGLGVLVVHFKDTWGAKRPTVDSAASYWLPAPPSPPPGGGRPTNALGISRGALVFALHPRENKTGASPHRPQMCAFDWDLLTCATFNSYRRSC
jgi:hypothetical protein